MFGGGRASLRPRHRAERTLGRGTGLLRFTRARLGSVNERTLPELDEVSRVAADAGVCELLLLPQVPIRSVLAIDASSLEGLRRWVDLQRALRLCINESSADGFPICHPLLEERGLCGAGAWRGRGGVFFAARRGSRACWMQEDAPRGRAHSWNVDPPTRGACGKVTMRFEARVTNGPAFVAGRCEHDRAKYPESQSSARRSASYSARKTPTRMRTVA